MSARAIRCPNGQACDAEECVSARLCMHADESGPLPNPQEAPWAFDSGLTRQRVMAKDLGRDE